MCGVAARFGANPRLPLRRIGGLDHRSGNQLDRLVRFGNRQIERRDAGRRAIEFEAAPLRRRADCGRKFQFDFVHSLVRNEQSVEPAPQSADEHAILFRRDLADGRVAEGDRRARPMFFQRLHGEHAVDSHDVLVELGVVVSFGDDGGDRQPRGARPVRLQPTQVFIQRDDGGRLADPAARS